MTTVRIMNMCIEVQLKILSSDGAYEFIEAKILEKSIVEQKRGLKFARGYKNRTIVRKDQG